MYLQRNRRESKPYFIKLDKLCENINLQTEGFARSQLWQKVEKGLEVLKSNNYLDSYKRDKNNIVRVWYVKQPKANDNKLEKPKSSPKASTDDPNPKITKMFVNLIDEKLNENQIKTLIDGISTIVEFHSQLPKSCFKVPEIRYEMKEPENLCRCYIKWIENNADWLDKIHVGIINSHNKVFGKFIEYYEEDCEYYGYSLKRKPK